MARVVLPTKTRIQRRVYLAFGVLLSSYEFSGPNEWADSPVLLSIPTRLKDEGIARIDNSKSVLSSSPLGESNDSIKNTIIIVAGGEFTVNVNVVTCVDFVVVVVQPIQGRPHIHSE